MLSFNLQRSVCYIIGKVTNDIDISKRLYWDGHMFCLPHGEEEMVVESEMLPSNGPPTTSPNKLMLIRGWCYKMSFE